MDRALREPDAREEIGRLMAEYGDGILRQCLLMLGDLSQAEDAAQETFVRAWQSYGGFRAEASEKTWLTAIAANVCRNLLRSPWNRRRVDLSFLEGCPAGETEPPDDTVVRAVLALPPKYRQVVVLYYYRDCSTGEIAQMLGVPQGTVSVRLKRARERLKPMLKEWYDEEG
ncbi:RNA polymerase sigma factor [Intestinimonas timonensis]|uniref:RNA polymerase sigma factor n=1 Tax=Intestinimonas timonensis TaxID=1689270 RepID=UPI003A92F646